LESGYGRYVNFWKSVKVSNSTCLALDKDKALALCTTYKVESSDELESILKIAKITSLTGETALEICKRQKIDSKEELEKILEYNKVTTIQGFYKAIVKLLWPGILVAGCFYSKLHEVLAPNNQLTLTSLTSPAITFAGWYVIGGSVSRLTWYATAEQWYTEKADRPYALLTWQPIEDFIKLVKRALQL
jgi:hypothetical protein